MTDDDDDENIDEEETEESEEEYGTSYVVTETDDEDEEVDIKTYELDLPEETAAAVDYLQDLGYDFTKAFEAVRDEENYDTIYRKILKAVDHNYNIKNSTKIKLLIPALKSMLDSELISNYMSEDGKALYYIESLEETMLRQDKD